ncbi:UDP-N-acetylmuramoyl-tripeptide--D-alanyl-D-alanine ligase [Bifidobacterium saguinibicoloris]|uniref:UDP-N-acetylmuramoyl-tripeptide--D-alanyl-D- alanine ligase n=1 Tax=Bifidobacterium saguinibicoloris TaxID=2834433 RepID=UPI001C598A55|nr:UDP-N-acetylmuramoyl-tripeptide--D-alanyl-D-alanine ligase [Bifidobacterium saguinibicoloris]MBW3081534.1 UDP-N-acetylmuramoyl-tripeptide--D-alanyl-D-alanine ligase [Bifidobacterium saguinibicoloris]
MMPMTIQEIAQAVEGRLVGPAAGVPEGPVAVHTVSDSRQVGEGTVFVAIKGERVDGHGFVGRVGESGAVAAIVDHEVAGADIAQIVVPDTVDALGALARHNIRRRREVEADGGKPFTLIGLTGSVGKTTTKDLLKALLSSMDETVAPVGSFNNEIGLPLTALTVGENTRYFVAEMGANHVGEIARLTTIAPPDIAIVLKVGVAHLGEFGSVERIAQAKSEIVQGLVPGGVAVLNADDAHVAAMAGIAPGKVLYFGVDAANADRDALHATDLTVDGLDRPSFTLVADDGDRAPVTLGIPGAHNVMNALAAASVARLLGMPLADIARVLGEQRRISPHRMAVSSVEHDGATFTLIDDSFNANPDSMRAGLDGLARFGTQDGRTPHRIAVLGAMLELGGDEEGLHRGIGAYAAGLGLDHIIAVGSATDARFDALAESIAHGAIEAAGGDLPVDWVHDAGQADELVKRIARDHADTVVLLKGSHASGLSALAERWTPDRA